VFVLQKKKSSYTHSGLITLNSIEVRQVYSFMDYLKGGTQLHCSIAIDFTGTVEFISVHQYLESCIFEKIVTFYR
jgi:hypothetical protein